MKSKKIISVIAAAMLAFGMTANAATMTLEEATEYALANSPAYKAAVATAKSNEYAAKVAKSTYNDYHDSDSALAQMSISSFDLYLVRMGYVKSASELQMRVAQRELERVDAQTKWSVKNNFYTYLSSEEKVKIAEKALESANQRLAYAELKHSQGAMSDIEYQSCELSVMQAENSLESAKRTKDANMRTLKSTMGYNLSEELTISGKFERDISETILPEKAISLAMEFNNVKTLKENLALAKERFTLADRWYFSSENEYWQEKYTYEAAQENCNSNITAIEVGIHSCYAGVMTYSENIAMLEKSLELYERRVQASKLQYEMGAMAVQDYIDVEQEYVDMQNQLVDLYVAESSAKYTYKTMYTY